MRQEKRTAYAYVTVELQITVGSWGPECTLKQATEQAQSSALGSLNALIKDNGHRFKVLKVTEVNTTFQERNESCPRCGQVREETRSE